MADSQSVPVAARVHLAHATLQGVADAAAVHVLHIKGPAIDPALAGGGAGSIPTQRRRSSVDADALVRPAHLTRFLAALRANGWSQVTPFLDHGLVQHSTVWFHPQLGQADIHYRFPGIGRAPEPAFELLWQDRTTAGIAHQACTAPSLTAQRLILLLHAARDPNSRAGDVQRTWETATPEERDAVRALAIELRAEVALAAATGTLEQYRDRPEHDLWKLYSEGHSTSSGFAKLRALAKAAPEGYEHAHARVVRHAVGAFLRAPQRLAASQTRRPTASEVAHAYGRLLRRARDVVGRR